ncbi:unnamed protein product [Pleuronectes platessa]|uniref:Uncharacterized protein n=1 Tax=Pleuronectes platessa TaxID=8262 RepID=A0A9N7YGC6_PLEPL|nr:unnamed protein product [Pleuronectes platessa]
MRDPTWSTRLQTTQPSGSQGHANLSTTYWEIIASREAAGTLPGREPMTLKSCTLRLPSNRPDLLKSDTPPLAPHLSTVLGTESCQGSTRGKKSTSFKSFNPPTPTTTGIRPFTVSS